MNYYGAVNSAIESNLCKLKGEKVAIYPFGDIGVTTKAVLNWRYGIKEAIIVDNHLASINPDIMRLEDVGNCEEYIWILTCSNPKFYHEIISSIRQRVSEERIIDIVRKTRQKGYSHKYRLLAHLGTEGYESISTPRREFLELVKYKKNQNRAITIAEVGVGCGASSVEVCKCLDEQDTYFCFDFEEIINDLLYDLNLIPEICCRLVGKGNSHKLYDSYSWNLCDLLFSMRDKNLNGLFDVVFLDGSHSFIHDGVSCCLLKELLRPNGFIIFDDLFWRGEDNDMVSNAWQDLYLDKQIREAQVKRVVNAFMIEDKNFQQIFLTQSYNSSCAAFKKVN